MSLLSTAPSTSSTDTHLADAGMLAAAGAGAGLPPLLADDPLAADPFDPTGVLSALVASSGHDDGGLPDSFFGPDGALTPLHLDDDVQQQLVAQLAAAGAIGLDGYGYDGSSPADCQAGDCMEAVRKADLQAVQVSSGRGVDGSDQVCVRGGVRHGCMRGLHAATGPKLCTPTCLPNHDTHISPPSAGAL